MRDRCAVPRTLLQCVCTQRRNRIGRLSPFSEYALYGGADQTEIDRLCVVPVVNFNRADN